MRHLVLALLGLLLAGAAQAQVAQYGPGAPPPLITTVATYSAMRAASPGASPLVCTQGFAQPFDYGDGCYSWKPSDSRTPDGTFLVSSTVGGVGNWVLHVPATGLHPQIAGAKCDYSMQTGTGTDDAAAINSLISRIQASGNNANGASNGSGEIVQVPGTTCLINSANTNTGRGVAFVGVGNPFSTTGGNPGAFSPMFAVNPSFHLTCGASMAVRNAVIWRAGLAQKPSTMEDVMAAVAQWSGETSYGIYNAASDCNIKDVTVIGFNTGVYSTNGPRLQIDQLYCDDANCLEATANGDTSYVRNSHAFPYWSFALNHHLGAYAAAVVAGGTSYSNGDTLTVPGGTCTTQPTLTPTQSGGVISSFVVLDSGDCTVTPESWGAASATINAGGSGGTNGAQVVTVNSGACTTPPQFNVTIAGGIITSVNSVATAGVCALRSQPNPITAVTGASLSGAVLNITMAKNALVLTGGSGTGATATVSLNDAGYRPGTCLNLHDQFDGGSVSGFECEEYQTNASLSNIWNTKLWYIGGEGGFDNYDRQPVGIATANCVSDTYIYNPNSDGEYYDLKLNQATTANGGNCSGAANQSASLYVIGGHLGFNGGVTQAAILTGSGSAGSITNTTLGWGGAGAGYPAALQIGAGSGQWLVDDVQFDSSTPTQQQFSQWVSVAGTAAPPISNQFAVGGQSWLINGDFSIDQLNEGGSQTLGSGLTADRWRRLNQGGPSMTFVRATSGPAGYANAENMTMGTGITITAALTNVLSQQIETVGTANFLQWGTVNAQPVVVEGWINASQVGTYGVALLGSGQTYSYVSGCAVASVNTWTYCSFVVPGPTGGSFPAAAGSAFFFDLDNGSGANLQTPTLNTWQAAKYTTFAGFIEVAATTAATVKYAGWHMWPGPFKKPTYTPPSYATELARAQRYFQKSFSQGTAVAQNSTAVGAVTMLTPFTSGASAMHVDFAAVMAKVPTITFYNTTAADANCYDSTKAASVAAGSAVNTGMSGFLAQCSLASGAPASGDQIQVQWSADTGF